MKIDFSKCILGLNGKPDADKTTLGNLACITLTTILPDEQNLAADQKVRRYELALLAAKGGIQDITPEQFTELKTLIGKLFGPLAVGRAYEIMDKAAAKTK